MCSPGSFPLHESTCSVLEILDSLTAMIPRHTLAAVTLIPLLIVGLAAPAAARPLTPDVVARADAAMMSISEARSLGITGKVVRAFGEIYGQAGPVDDPWLCDLDGDREVEGAGASSELQVEIFNGWDSGYIVENELLVYPDARQARKSMRLIRQLAPSCSGVVTSNEDRGPVTYRLSNGSGETRSGVSYVWTYSRALSAEQPLDFQDNYITFTRIGRYVQVVELESLGRQTGNLTEDQRREARKLTGVLADRARALMP